MCLATGKPYNISTLNQELVALRRILGLAHEWKVIDRIPTVRRIRGAAGRNLILSSEQKKAHLGAAEQEYRDFATLLLDAGLRVGETLSLEWSEVHLDPPAGSELGYLTVLASKAKNSKARHIPMTPRLAGMLRDRGEGRKGYVFQSEQEPLTLRWVQHHHDRLGSLLKLDEGFVPHSMRHTFGTRLGESGADAFTIMRLMGHSTITMSAKYVHPTGDLLERAIASMAGVALSDDVGGHKVVTGNPVTTISMVQ